MNNTQLQHDLYDAITEPSGWTHHITPQREEYIHRNGTHIICNREHPEQYVRWDIGIMIPHPVLHLEPDTYIPCIKYAPKPIIVGQYTVFDTPIHATVFDRVMGLMRDALSPELQQRRVFLVEYIAIRMEYLFPGIQLPPLFYDLYHTSSMLPLHGLQPYTLQGRNGDAFDVSPHQDIQHAIEDIRSIHGTIQEFTHKGINQQPWIENPRYIHILPFHPNTYTAHDTVEKQRRAAIQYAQYQRAPISPPQTDTP